MCFSLERNFQKERKNVETEKLKYIKKLTLNMRKAENDQQTESLQLSLETGNGPKNEETESKTKERKVLT